MLTDTYLSEQKQMDVVHTFEELQFCNNIAFKDNEGDQLYVVTNMLDLVLFDAITKEERVIFYRQNYL